MYCYYDLVNSWAVQKFGLLYIATDQFAYYICLRLLSNEDLVKQEQNPVPGPACKRLGVACTVTYPDFSTGLPKPEYRWRIMNLFLYLPVRASNGSGRDPFNVPTFSRAFSNFAPCRESLEWERP